MRLIYNGKHHLLGLLPSRPILAVATNKLSHDWPLKQMGRRVYASHQEQAGKVQCVILLFLRTRVDILTMNRSITAF